MANQPLVSIGVPAFKTVFLKEAITSLLRQTYTNIEVVIVNDCSPYPVRDIVEQFGDSRIRYFENEKNVGKNDPANNWNRCLEHSHGEYFCLLCDDDLYDPQFVESMLALAAKFPKTNVFRSRVSYINKDGEVTGFYPSSPVWETTIDYVWHVCNNYRYQTISEFFYRRKRLTECGGYANLPLAWYADYLSIYRFSELGGIASDSRCLVHFRQSGENISSKDNENIIPKLQASQQYIEGTEKIIRASDFPQKEHLVNVLNYRVSVITNWHLSHTPFVTLLTLVGKHKSLGITKKQIWRALTHHHS